MTKSQKKAIEEYLTGLMQDAPNYTNIAILHAHFETARHILTTLGQTRISAERHYKSWQIVL